MVRDQHLDYTPDLTRYGSPVTAENASEVGIKEDTVWELFVYEALLFVSSESTESELTFVCFIPEYREDSLRRIIAILGKTFELSQAAHLEVNFEIPVRPLSQT